MFHCDSEWNGDIKDKICEVLTNLENLTDSYVLIAT